MKELTFLNLFLGVAFVLAPLMTNRFFLGGSRVYSDAHKLSLFVLIIGAATNLNFLAAVWPLFCIFGFLLYMRNELISIFSVNGLVGCIPFVFSIISSVWFVAGVNDLHLLGYDRAWSFYAALHGSFLGWIFVGCLAFLAKRPGAHKMYQWGCPLCFVFFLLVAFGIDGVPLIKRIGVIGLSVIVPLAIGMYAFTSKKENKTSALFASLSLVSIIVSMALAVLNEFWIFHPLALVGVPIMVLAHGFLNAIFAIPCFYLAIRLEHASSSNQILHDRVVFFDGFCVLCSGTVRLLIKIDKKRFLKYSSLQGNLAKVTLDSRHFGSNESVVFWEEGVFYERSEAVIRILVRLGGAYKIAGFALRIFPFFALNFLYNFIARNRFRIFGKNDSCLVPTTENRDRFIP